MKSPDTNILDPKTRKPRPASTASHTEAQESYSINAHEIDPKLFARLRAKLEEAMRDIGLDSAGRSILKGALEDEINWLNPNTNRTPECQLFSSRPTILRKGLRSLFAFCPYVSGTADNGHPVTLTCDSFEHERGEITATFVDYLTRRHEQAQTLGSASASAWRQAILLARQPEMRTSTYDRILELADAATQELEGDMNLGPQMVTTAAIERLEKIVNDRLPKQRKDVGKKHAKRQLGAWRSREEVAADFNNAAFPIKGKRGKMATCSPRKIMDWDRRHPDANRPDRFGYHAQLHLDTKYRDDYYTCLHNWLDHWEEYERQYKEWRLTHPKSPFSAFRFNKDSRLDFEADVDGYC